MGRADRRDHRRHRCRLRRAHGTRYWGAQTGATTDGIVAACVALTTPSTGIATCNGDGDGTIANSGAHHETARSWQHLANAGMVEGSYAGVAGTQPGVNYPRSRLSSAGWNLQTPNYALFSTLLFPAEYRNVLLFSGSSGILKAEEMYNIDMKMDDGKPHTGMMITRRAASSPACVVSTDDAYYLSDQTKGCSHIFFITRQ